MKKTRLRNVLLGLVIAPLLTSCAGSHYRSTDTGELSGDLVVQWMKPDKFLFLPSSSSPLTFVRSNGKSISPGRMYTDGGSVPRPLRALKNYSPWGYAPAFIVHDWLFYMQNCKIAGFDEWTVEEAARVMSEVMKTMMESDDFDFGDRQTVYLMYLAVQTEPARQAWNSNRCTRPPSDKADFVWIPDAVFEISTD